MDLMSRYPDKHFELAIVDPPYFEGPNKSGFYGKGVSSLGVQRTKFRAEIQEWEIPTEEYFIELNRVSKNQIVWGANHFSDNMPISSSSCYIVWDKDNGKSNFADAEIAYTSFKSAVRIFKYMWNGMHQGSYGGDVSKNEKRIHPTQKPIKLYEWLLMKYAKKGDKILDTHLGSGSIAIACFNLGYHLTACDLDTVVYNDSINRIDNHISQGRLRFPE
ncbi:MAG: DNA methyltransferase [Candidatus Bathyarchaeia archaeon]